MFKIIVKSVVVLIIACIVGVLFRVVDITFFREKEVALNDENVVTINDLIVENKTIEEVFQEKEVDDVGKDDNQTQKNSIKQTEVKNNSVTETKVEKKEKNDIIKKTEEKKEQVSEQPKEENKREVVEQVKKENTEQIVEQPKQETAEQPKEEVKEQVIEQPKTLKEEYRENTELINKIKNIIKNNETEDMKMYGYDIVVDSTIPEMTNEFTFSEQRVINKLAWKFGTIRIYVRDYYCNGTYISTQCFII